MAISCTHPCISVHETSLKTIKKLSSQIMGKEVGYYLYVRIIQMTHTSYCTATCHLEAVPCDHLYSLNSNTCKKSTYILQIKIKCYKRDAYKLPSHMAHVLQHVYTCIHYTQYLLQFSPYFIINYT